MESRTCQNCKKDFTIEPDDFSFYEKMGVPAPTFCPECRQKRRILFRNFRTLYKVPSAKSGATTISMYGGDQAFPVWTTKEWYADDWDPLDYGREFDFSRPFFDQYKELDDCVPRFALMVNNSEDCDYTNLTNRSAHCYFSFGCVDNEYVDYSHSIWNCRNVADSLYVFKSENCYECIDVLDSNGLLYSQECESCASSVGLFDCRGCTDCIGCVGLRNKSRHIFNIPVSREEYDAFLAEHPLDQESTLRLIADKVEELKKTVPTPRMFGSHNVDVTGNHIYHAKNVRDSFDIKSGEDSRFGYTIRSMTASYDCSFSLTVDNCYEVVFSQSYGLMFTHLVVDCSDVVYSQFCFNCTHCFGCTGLRKRDYCILNKQYTKEEYEYLVPKIIEHMKSAGEWGEFFPARLSPFAYNESTVGEYYPLTKEEAISAGYVWKDSIPEQRGTENARIVDIAPDDRYDWQKISGLIFACDTCQRNFRFIEREVTFYKRIGVALPKSCFFCRHQNRMNKRLERRLFHRRCSCNVEHHGHEGSCSNEFETSYAPDRPEIVYCESCYQKEVI